MNHVGAISEVDVITSSVGRYDNPESVIKGWIELRPQNSRITITTRARNSFIDSVTGKESFLDYDLSSREITNTFVHEIGHNVAERTPAFRIHKANLKRVHELLLQYENYDNLFGGNSYFRSFDEFFAETYRFAVRNPHKLRKINKILRKYEPSFNIINIYDDILR